MAPSPYTPDETPQTLEYERTFIAGDVIAGTGYGIQLMLYVSCARFLWKRRRTGLQPKILLAYMSLLLVIESIWIGVQSKTIQVVYIDNSGGPWAFFLASQTLAVDVMFDAMYFLLTWLSDLLVLWRCYVIWSAAGDKRLAWVAITFPGLLILSSFVLGCLWTFYSTQPASNFYVELPLHIGTAYFTISFSSNVIVTLLIAGRLIAYRRSSLLPPELTAHFISLATIVIESAALYSGFAVLFLITYAINDPTNQIWLPVASACQQISNLLIIYRLAEGSAWQQDTLNNTSQNTMIHFKNAGGPVDTDATQSGAQFREADPEARFSKEEEVHGVDADATPRDVEGETIDARARLCSS
uniref:Uncharacterized protein n=1 Tax=Mycena chlorophos TaxID=658473 RepID=A0ABQ0LY04_MYCCL|nr:predicted protein [Mycena chlorophos]